MISWRSVTVVVGVIGLLLLCSVAGQGYGYGDSILLESVRTLTFGKSGMTTGRRSAPIPQLQCIGGSARGSYHEPTSVQCQNVGSDGAGNVQWECKADLDSEVRFGETVVSCEGYNYPEDPYILKGSCGLEYTLDYTEAGRQNSYNHYSKPGYHTYDNRQHGFSWGNVFLMVIAGLVIYGIVKQCLSQPVGGTGYSHGAHYGGYPSGGPSPGPGYGAGYNNYGPGCNPTYPTNTWRPGFWSGFGGGSLFGYAMGRNRGYGSGFGSGYGTGYRSSGYSGFRSSSSSPRTATAFASTRRR